MRSIFLGIFSSFLFQFSTAQELLVDISKKDLLFDANRISSLGIRDAAFEIFYKYDGEIIKNSRNEIYYHFNENGQIQDRIVIHPFKKRKDSVVTLYIRNEKGLVVSKVVHDPIYTYVDLMRYKNNKLVKQENYQMKRSTHWNENLDSEKLMWSDSIFYGPEGLEVYNRFGTKYKKYKIEKNEFGNITEVKTYDRRGKWEQTMSAEYQDDQLIELKVRYASKLMYDWSKVFEYNEFGLTQEKYFKEGKLEYIRKITYNERALPELDIKRNEETGKMVIHKIEYLSKKGTSEAP